MIGLFQTGKTKRQITLIKFLLAFFVCALFVTWIGISTPFANEDDPADDMENPELSFQNAAQEQHARNVAIKAALQDPDLIKAISEAKEKEDFDGARALFKEKVEANIQQISIMRDEGRGWGEIAKEFDVHPKYLGLGHFKHETKYATQTKHGSQKYNGHRKDKDRGRALGHSKDKSGGHGVGHGRGNGGGHGHGNGGGHGHGNGGGHGKGKK